LQKKSKALIRDLGYQEKIHFRPPYGKKLFMLPYYLEQQGITTVMWSVAPENYNAHQQSAEDIVRKTLDAVKPGAIILLHANYREGTTRRALPEIITQLKKRGYEFTTVSELITLSENSSSKN